MSTAYYIRAREFAGALAAQLATADLQPRDMIDVQGFLWGHLMQVAFGLAATPTGSTRTCCLSSSRGQVYATDWGCRPEIAEFFKDIEKLSADDRKTRRAELENALAQVGERKALTTLFDLVGRPGSLLPGVSVTYDQKTKQSVIRISGAAETRRGYSFDEKLGHELKVRWRSQISQIFVLPGRLFPLLNGTSASLPTADALDAFSTPYLPAPGEAETEEVGEDIEKPVKPAKIEVVVERTPYPVSRGLDGLFMPEDEDERLLRIWRQKRNLVLQGAPGVGKSFVARRLAYSLIGYEDPTRVQMI